MTVNVLNGLWNYLQTLSLTQRNKKWLAERLLNADSAKKTDLDLAIEDEKAGRLIAYKSLEDLIKDI